jgi:hypothetical protein
MKNSTLKALLYSVGGMSNPSKMPCFGWSIPAEFCKLGTILRKVAGTVCSKCYAMGGMYIFPNVVAALENRYLILMKCQGDHSAAARWVGAMAEILNRRLDTYWKRGLASKAQGHDARVFRWHDAGDLQGLWHLKLIRRVCMDTPGVTHWLPTRELEVVKEYVAAVEAGLIGWHPSNLCIKISAMRVGTPNGAEATRLALKYPWISLSMVHPKGTAVPPDFTVCPAKDQDGECRDCRKCWSQVNVSYELH